MKKTVLLALFCGALLMFGVGCGEKEAPVNTAGIEAQETLLGGNAEYLGGLTDEDITEDTRLKLATEGQFPYATIVTCSDSRVPAELIFDAGLGELFVIRTAGNVVGDYEIGSVEYAAEHLGCPLVVVMGHTHCGAVGAALEGPAEGYIGSLVDEILPSVELAKNVAGEDESAIGALAEDINIANSISKLRTSPVLSELEAEAKVTIVGAKYDITTGEVTFINAEEIMENALASAPVLEETAESEEIPSEEAK